MRRFKIYLTIDMYLVLTAWTTLVRRQWTWCCIFCRMFLYKGLYRFCHVTPRVKQNCGLSLAVVGGDLACFAVVKGRWLANSIIFNINCRFFLYKLSIAFMFNCICIINIIKLDHSSISTANFIYFYFIIFII